MPLHVQIELLYQDKSCEVDKRGNLTFLEINEEICHINQKKTDATPNTKKYNIELQILLGNWK